MSSIIGFDKDEAYAASAADDARDWVRTEEGRASKLGQEIECKKCEIPSKLSQ